MRLNDHPQSTSYIQQQLHSGRTKNTKRIQIEIRMLASYEVSLFRA